MLCFYLAVLCVCPSPIPTSASGGPAWLLPGEPWPTFEGERLTLILTICTDELPKVPPQLQDYRLLQIFATEQFGPPDEDEGSIRIIPHFDLHRLQATPQPGIHLKINWLETEDFPNYYQLAATLDEEEYVAYTTQENGYKDIFPNHDGIKIGGWPTLIQETAFLCSDEPEFVFQFDSNDVFSFADCGIGYFLRKTTGEWYTCWETL